MYKDTYERMVAPLRRYPRSGAILGVLDKVCVGAVVASYVVLLAWLLVPTGPGGAWQQISVDPAVMLPGQNFIRVLLTTAIGFLLLTLLRAAINAPRPCDKDGIDPLTSGHAKGKSFPGRHAFSAALIASAWLYVDVDLGISALALMLVISLLRVLEGAHYPRDVVAGMLLGLVFGGIGLWLIP